MLMLMLMLMLLLLMMMMMIPFDAMETKTLMLSTTMRMRMTIMMRAAMARMALRALTYTDWRPTMEAKQGKKPRKISGGRRNNGRKHGRSWPQQGLDLDHFRGLPPSRSPWWSRQNGLLRPSSRHKAKWLKHAKLEQPMLPYVTSMSQTGLEVQFLLHVSKYPSPTRTCWTRWPALPALFSSNCPAGKSVQVKPHFMNPPVAKCDGSGWRWKPDGWRIRLATTQHNSIVFSFSVRILVSTNSSRTLQASQEVRLS